MKIEVCKLLGKEWLDRSSSFTVNKEVHPDLYKMYKSEHSPIRTQIFWVEMIDIATFISVHFVRHKHGVEHWVKSNRDDRPGHIEDRGRYTPVNHAMFCNAQSLINMARRRLCFKAHKDTVSVMQAIKDEVQKIDPDLAACMLPDCLYRQGCYEFKSCGYFDSFKQGG